MTVRVTILGPDRQPWRGGPMRVCVVDPADPASRLADLTTTVAHLPITFAPERFDRGESYILSVAADGYRTAWEMVTAEDFSGEGRITLLMLPKVGLPSVDEPMSLLNISAAMKAHRVGGASVWSYVKSVDTVRPDRIIATVDPRLETAVASSQEWAPASAALHPGFPVSWKCRTHRAGNLQLSFSADRVKVDADIDLARGVGHAVEVIRNRTTRQTTDQIAVYGALVANGIDPGYVLIPAAEAA